MGQRRLSAGFHVHHDARRCLQDNLKTVNCQERGVPCKLMLYSLACCLPQANTIPCPPSSHPLTMPPQYIISLPPPQPPIYCGICSNGCASFSWQNGSLPAVQISVSCGCPNISTAPLRKRPKKKREKTHRLQPLLNLNVQRPPLDRNHRRRLGVVRDRRPALGAEPPVHGVAAVGRALPLLDGARGGEFVFGDYDDEGWRRGG